MFLTNNVIALFFCGNLVVETYTTNHIINGGSSIKYNRDGFTMNFCC
jgi:hypothetical protein